MSKRSGELGPELESCKHMRGLATRRCLYCGVFLPLEYPTCASTPSDLELAFQRYARAAAALIERGECDSP